MPFAILVYNINSTLNKNRSIKEFAILQLAINNYYKCINLAVTELGDINLFLEYNWLKIHNLSINQVNVILSFNCHSETYEYQNSSELDELNQDIDYKQGKENQIFFFN